MRHFLFAVFVLCVASCTFTCVSPIKVGYMTPDKPTYRFAVIGDFGNGGVIERWAQEDMQLNEVKTIFTVGDNIYPSGTSGYEYHVGAFFYPWITTPKNHFWPAPGNHDWNGENSLRLYQAFFHVPRYYDIDLDDRHMIHLYVLDSDPREPDGIGWDSKQAEWFRSAFERNRFRSCFHFVTFHHPPMSTKVDQSSFCGGCEPVKELNWPFRQQGIDGVFSGHAHWGERWVYDGLNYWTVGNTTDDLDSGDFARTGESKYFDNRAGYLLGEVGSGWLALGFKIVEQKKVNDITVIRKECPISF